MSAVIVNINVVHNLWRWSGYTNFEIFYAFHTADKWRRMQSREATIAAAAPSNPKQTEVTAIWKLF